MARSNYEYPGYSKSGATYWSKNVVLYVVVTFGALWMTLPFFWMLSAAVSVNPSSSSLAFIPKEVTFDHFVTVWETLPMFRWFLNTFLFAGAVTLFNLTFDSLAGYALAKIDFWQRERLFLVFISTMMIPGMVTLIPVYLLLAKLGWVDTYQGLIAPLAANPFGIFLLRQHFKGLPSALGDAAQIDGCNAFQTFYKIYLPLAKPALATLGIFTFVWTWNNFEWPLIIASSEKMYTVTVGIFLVNNRYYNNWGLMMAATAMITVPVIVAFLAGQKYFIRGMTLSGMKG